MTPHEAICNVGILVEIVATVWGFCFCFAGLEATETKEKKEYAGKALLCVAAMVPFVCYGAAVKVGTYLNSARNLDPMPLAKEYEWRP